MSKKPKCQGQELQSFPVLFCIRQMNNKRVYFKSYHHTRTPSALLRFKTNQSSQGSRFFSGAVSDKINLTSTAAHALYATEFLVFYLNISFLFSKE